MLLKASLHGLKRQRGGWGGRSPPHLQTQRRYDGFWEGSYGFCLCRQDDTWSDVAQLKKGEPPLQLETDCLYDEFWKALKQFCVWCKSSSWCYVLENKPAQPKKKPGGGGVGGAQPPHLQTQRRYDGFWEGPYGFCLCWQDDARSDLAQLNKIWI